MISNKQLMIDHGATGFTILFLVLEVVFYVEIDYEVLKLTMKYISSK